MSITIQNRLEIRPGNIIMVPGCEPISAFTSVTLANNSECIGTIISLETAKAVIPGWTIVAIQNGGSTFGSRRFFVLPDGPPPQPGCSGTKACQVDWYQILRDNAQPMTSSGSSESDNATCNPCDLFTINKKCGIF